MVVFIMFSIIILQPVNSQQNNSSDLQVLSIVPHDSNAFTQGLEIYNGKFYESTGLYGSSSVRIVNMKTGVIESQYNLSDDYFGEGLTIYNDTIIQLTWRENIAFIYDADTLELVGNFTYEGEGWGICKSLQGDYFRISDGTEIIQYFSNDFSPNFNQDIYLNSSGVMKSVTNLNELECTDNAIIANVWHEDSIYLIDYSNGKVCRSVDISSIREQYENENSGVLNGIAWDQNNGTYWITGKNWQNYYEIEIDDSSCQTSEPVVETGDEGRQLLQGNEELLLVVTAILILTILIDWLSQNKKSDDRQNEKPPRLGDDEE